MSLGSCCKRSAWCQKTGCDTDSILDENQERACFTEDALIFDVNDSAVNLDLSQLAASQSSGLVLQLRP